MPKSHQVRELEMRTCQFCKKQDFRRLNGATRLFKYGVRHYAHAACGLKAFDKKFFTKLASHDLRAFPALVASDYGLLDDLDMLQNDAANSIETHVTKESKRRKKMAASLGECRSCGRKCDVVEMATHDNDDSFTVCDECLEHASTLL